VRLARGHAVSCIVLTLIAVPAIQDQAPGRVGMARVWLAVVDLLSVHRT